MKQGIQPTLTETDSRSCIMCNATMPICDDVPKLLAIYF